MPVIPLDAGLALVAAFVPAARRQLLVFGAPAELLWLPQRSARHGRPTSERAAFRASIAERIVAEEASWSGGGLVVTPNRFPFAIAQRIVWPAVATREHDVGLLTAVFDWVDRLDGTGLINGIGAAASIPRAHAHVTTERLPFLGAVGERVAVGDFLPVVAGVEYVCKQVPCCVLGVRGEAAARARAVFALGMCRMTAAVAIVVTAGTAWLMPRAAEIPEPWFPYAFGAAELWGRWCYGEEEPFARATGADLERAMVMAGVAPLHPWS